MSLRNTFERLHKPDSLVWDDSRKEYMDPAVNEAWTEFRAGAAAAVSRKFSINVMDMFKDVLRMHERLELSIL